MRASVLALLACLLPATHASAEGVVVEAAASSSAPGISVSWQLPPGFEESELLLQIEGGPRVRLTDELRGSNPRVVVVLPVLAGRAHFVVRAGREDEDERGHREEIDVATSESFDLAGRPTTGRVPVRAAATRPVAGAEMEWWAQAAGRPVEGPSPVLESPPSAAGAAEPASAPALPSSRPLPPASPAGASSGFREAPQDVSDAPANGIREPAFRGAATPLRN